MATYNDGKGYNMGTGAAHVAAGINKVSAVSVTLNFATSLLSVQQQDLLL